MVKCEVIEKFTLADYKKLKNVKKVVVRKENEFGIGDTFECDEKMASYLTGDNKLKRPFVKIIEVIPKKEKPIKLDEDDVKVITEVVKKTTKKTTKKKKEK